MDQQFPVPTSAEARASLSRTLADACDPDGYCELHNALAGALALLHSLSDDAFEDHPDAWGLIDQYSAVLAEADGGMCLD